MFLTLLDLVNNALPYYSCSGLEGFERKILARSLVPFGLKGFASKTLACSLVRNLKSNKHIT